MFENLEAIFQSWRDLNEYSKSLVTLTTATGCLFIVLYTIKFAFGAINGFRLYVWAQFCNRTNLVEKYGKWAVVSGSTDGIGLSMAKELASRGHSLIVIGRNEEKLMRTKVLLEEEPNVGEVITVKIDLSDSSIENFENIRDKIDPDNRDIGILINNAGTFPDTYMRFNNFDLEFIRTIVNVNVLSTVYLTRMIMPGMVDRGKGLILNVSSILGSVPTPYMCVYGPTKSFVDSFSRMLQIEYSSHPLDVINLTTGAVHTKLFRNTALIPKPTIFNPTPDDYAKSALNAASTRISSISGTLMMGLSYKIAHIFNCLGLLPLAMKLNLMFNARNYRLSPVMKRKNSQQTNERGQDPANTH